ncbi:MAG: endospore germination permease [Firmicutes bacterium]|nr:endospore germination permease [Bacillota bacterium]
MDALHKVTTLQLTGLSVWVIVGAGILALPTAISRHVVQSAWLVAVIFIALVLPQAWLATTLVRRFPGRSFVGMARESLGPFLGAAVGLAFSLWWVLPLMATGRILAEFVTFSLLDLTPKSVILGAMAVSVAVVLWRGPIATARLAEILLPVIFAGLLAWFLIGLPDAEIRYLLPIGAEGLGTILRASLAPVAFGGSLMATLALGGYLGRAARVGRGLYWSVLIAGDIGLMAELLTTSVLGWLRPHLTFPHFHTARLIGLAEFLELVDSAFAAVILAGIFVTCAVLIFAVAEGVAETVGKRAVYPWALLGGAAVLTFGTPLALPTFPILVAALDSWYPPVALAVQVGLPLMVLVVAAVRRVPGEGTRDRSPGRPQRGSRSDREGTRPARPFRRNGLNCLT